MPKHTCKECSHPIIGRKATALFCSAVCKYRNYYKKKEVATKPERTCEVVDCGKKHLAKGYCRQHYRAIANPDKPRDRLVHVICIDCGATARKGHGSGTCYKRCQQCAIAQRGNRKRWPSSNLFTGTCEYCDTAFAGELLRKILLRRLLPRNTQRQVLVRRYLRHMQNRTNRKGEEILQPLPRG